MADTSIATAIPALTASLESAASALPATDSVVPPEHGITLLDAKNDIFLSYLQALALRNLEVIRSVRKHISANGNTDESAASKSQELNNEIVRNLVQHRVYLEKGVRPLEDRLKYQIDKVVRAADDAGRAAAQNPPPATTNGHHASDDDASETASDSDASDGNAALENNTAPTVNGTSHGPNASAFTRPTAATSSAARRSTSTNDTGVYRPPRITATSMPTPERREKRDRRPTTSATIDEFITSELSAAPAAEPSIGSTIEGRGRHSKSARQRADEAERRDYEETNLVRLPKEGKKDKGASGGNKRGGYGGEEWRGLGEGLDRIDRLTKRKSGSGGALERSRKRGRETEDGPRGDGGAAAGVGGEFEKKRKKVMRRMK